MPDQQSVRLLLPAKKTEAHQDAEVHGLDDQQKRTIERAACIDRMLRLSEEDGTYDKFIPLEK
jgi:hypothetical protein